MNSWWTLDCKGNPGLENEYDLIFQEPYHWKAEFSEFEPNKKIEFKGTKSDDDWRGKKFGFILKENFGQTD